MAKKYTGRDVLLAGKNTKTEAITLETGIIYVHALTARQLLQYNEKIEALKKVNPELGTENSLELVALLIVYGASDKEGVPLFTVEDVDKLMDSSIDDLTKISMKVLELSGMKQGILDEVAANLKNDQKSSSISE